MTLDKFKDTSKRCDPGEVALKTFFLGPQAENGIWLLDVIKRLMEQWFAWRQSLYPEDGRAISAADQNLPEFTAMRANFENYLNEISRAFEKEMPKFSPRYNGHMFSEISLPAFLGHFVTLMHNPNNISSEASRVGVRIEDEAVHALMKMIGFDPRAGRGHFTSGGTIANFEAIVRARARHNKWLAAAARKNLAGDSKYGLFEAAHLGWEHYLESVAYPEDVQGLETLTTNPFDLARHFEKAFKREYRGPVTLVPESKHYSWDKGVNLLGYGKESLWGIALDRFGRLSAADLGAKIERAAREERPVLLVCSVAGTTERGSIDHIHEVEAVLERWRKQGIHLWHHVDAAYGAFFRTVARSQGALSAASHDALDAIGRANSVTLDPHKLGYVPYSSGAFLCRTGIEYSLSYIDAPYINFHSATDRGPLTLEGSRPAGGAVATWMTSKCIGFDSGGYGRILERTIHAAERLEILLREADRRIRVLPHRDSNIVCFCIAGEGEETTRSNARTLAVYEAFSPARDSRFIVSKTNLKWSAYGNFLDEFTSSWNAKPDAESLTVIRVCMMNPFHDSREMKSDLSLEFVNALISLLGEKT